MERLGPFEPMPRLAVAVSGGADSLALAVLARRWVEGRSGSALALVLDHGLRPAASAEAELTRERLTRIGLPCVLRRLDLAAGTGLAERAREARLAMLATLCREHGILHLLLGHHAADQAETVLIRSLSGSGAAGLAGMAGQREIGATRLLRPLLAIPPVRLRATLCAAGLDWVEDPSNKDGRALRPRLRGLRSDRDGDGAATRALAAAAAKAGAERAARERSIAAALATRVTVRPEGFALLRAGPLDAAALAAVIQAVSGARFPPSPAPVAALAAAPRAITLAGIRLMPAGRLGPGWLVIREQAAMAPPVPAGASWDGRFRLATPARTNPGLRLGALGHAAAGLRRCSALPAAVLRTLPALRLDGVLYAVPHLGWPDAERCAGLSLVFCPARPVACAPFLAAG